MKKRTKYDRFADRLAAGQWFPDDVDNDWAIIHFTDMDILVMVDRRPGERPERERMGFRNYLYGWDCKIIAERSAPDYHVMLIDRSADILSRLRREFWILTIRSDEKPDNYDELDERTRKWVDEYGRVEHAHRVWGRVAVENGKPIGVYVNHEVVRQPVKQHWTEMSKAA